MYLITQLVHFIIQPWHIFLLLIGLGLTFSSFGFRRFGQVSLWTAVGFLGLVSITPIADTLAYTLEDRVQRGDFDLQDIEGAIILGGSTGPLDLAQERGVHLLTGASERLDKIVSLRRQRPGIPIIVTGNPDEAAMTHMFLTHVGIDPDSVMFEDESTNTYENAQFTAELLSDRPGDYLLITSARHMPRSLGTFRQAGIDVIPYPVDYRARRPSWSLARINPTERFELLDDMVDEAVGLVVYWMLGRSDALFPEN